MERPRGRAGLYVEVMSSVSSFFGSPFLFVQMILFFAESYGVQQLPCGIPVREETASFQLLSRIHPKTFPVAP